jgi:hypothetical protein
LRVSPLSKPSSAHFPVHAASSLGAEMPEERVLVH